MNKPFSQSCENNKAAILIAIKPIFKNASQVLEIGSGTGQHAVHFAKCLPHLHWQTSDQAQYHQGINAWLNDSQLPNISAPLNLNVDHQPWPIANKPDAIFTANTLHIMGWSSVVNFFAGVGKHLTSGGSLCVYGPFNYGGKYTSESNARFDVWLAQQSEHSAIRDFETVCTLADKQGLKLINDYEMPANNRLLHWEKQ